MLRQRAHGAEPGVHDGNEDGLGPAGHDRIRIAAADRLEGLPHGAAAGGAGGDHRHIGATEAKRDRDVPGGGVGQHVLDEGRADPAQAALLQDALLFEQDSEPACGAAEDHPDIVE